MEDMKKEESICNVNPADCKSEFGDIKDMLKEMHKQLFVGNGTPAVVTRIDRLEQKEQSRSKLTWLFIGAFVIVIVNQGWGLITKLSEKQTQVQTGKP